MAHYVDGFVVPVPKRNIDAYRRMAKKASKIWREYGALDYRECVADDLDVKVGLPFPRGIKLKAGETVVFSWITYKSRAHRDRANAKIMKDPRLAAMCGKSMPFDCKRMLYGGFKVIVEI
ncbi:MAG: RNA signal recognition particle [Verrucomicrobia bacterium Tous-C9LFEB]|nr:MAG: RNA signal recognition particle [Verrucomicrobia bacterium Tous-C9LFEB]